MAAGEAGGRGGFEGFGGCGKPGCFEEPGKCGNFGEPADSLTHPTFLKLKKLLGVGNMEEVALLVAGLDLEVVGWWGCC